MEKPVNEIEWLLNRIMFEENVEALRSHAINLVIMLEDPEPINIVYGQELEAEGFYDNYEGEDQEYDDGSGWLDEDPDVDKETWVQGCDYVAWTAKNLLGKV